MLGTTDPWVTLGLEPCGDFRRVRRAYAAKAPASLGTYRLAGRCPVWI